MRPVLAAKQAFAARSPDSRVGPPAVPSLLSAASAAPRLVAVQTRAAKQKSLRGCCSLPGAWETNPRSQARRGPLPGKALPRGVKFCKGAGGAGASRRCRSRGRSWGWQRGWPAEVLPQSGAEAGELRLPVLCGTQRAADGESPSAGRALGWGCGGDASLRTPLRRLGWPLHLQAASRIAMETVP